jgi:hypothetical protein
MRSMIQAGHVIICKTKTIDEINGIGFFYSQYQATEKKKYRFLNHLYTAKYLIRQSDIDFMNSFEAYHAEKSGVIYKGRPVAGRNAPGIVLKADWPQTCEN